MKDNKGKLEKTAKLVAIIGGIVTIFLSILNFMGITTISDIFPQEKNYFQKADSLFEHKDYNNAINYYKLAIKNKQNISKAKYSIGNCYKELGYLSEAQKWYNTSEE